MTFVQTASTICFKPYTLEEALRGLAEAGFVNVEISSTSIPTGWGRPRSGRPKPSSTATASAACP